MDLRRKGCWRPKLFRGNKESRELANKGIYFEFLDHLAEPSCIPVTSGT